MGAMVMACWALAALGVGETRVLILPIENRSGASADLGESITQLTASHAAKAAGYHITTFKEVEGTMSQEQLRQVAGCSSSSCAAEIAGALSVDELVMGSLGKIGNNYVLTFTRITAKNAQSAARVSEIFPALNENAIVERLPDMVSELFGGPHVPAPRNAQPPAPPPPPAPAPVVAAVPSPAPPARQGAEPQPAEGQGSVLPMALLGGGAGLLGLGALALLAGVAAGVGAGAVTLGTFSILGVTIIPVLPGLLLARVGVLAALAVVAGAGTVLALLGGASGTAAVAVGGRMQATK